MKKIFISILIIFILANLLFLGQVSANSLTEKFKPENNINTNTYSITNVNLETNVVTEFDLPSIKAKENVQSAGDINYSYESIDPYIPEGSMISPNKIIGGDDRTRIQDTSLFPYHAIGRIEIKFNNDSNTYAGTAFMISKNVAVTAAHCVYDKDKGLASSITIYPGAEGLNNNPYGSATTRNMLYPTVWASDNDKNYDWAILCLNTDIGNNCGWMGIRKFDDYKACIGQDVTLSGYPVKDAMVGWQYCHSGNIEGASENLLTYKLDMTSGQSGCPVYMWDGYAIGVNTREYLIQSKNEANRVNQFMFDTASKAISDNL